MLRNDARIDLASALQQAENRDFPRRASTALALAPAAEIRLVHLDLTTDDPVRFELLVIANDLTQTMEVISRRLAVHTNQRRRATRRRARHKMLNQTGLLRSA